MIGNYEKGMKFGYYKWANRVHIVFMLKHLHTSNAIKNGKVIDMKMHSLLNGEQQLPVWIRKLKKYENLLTCTQRTPLYYHHKEVFPMLLNEIINEVGMTKRAVKYYEEKGLLSVEKDSNGYRNYSVQDVETLKKISVYRKLGIGIKDIQSLLESGDKSILLRIYQEKLEEKALQESELEALRQFIDDGNADKANELLDYQTVENAIESLLPGKEWGDYLKSHFKPFLNVRLRTPEQKQALRNILEYCDETTLKVPFIMGMGVKLAGGIIQEKRTADEMIAHYRDMSESEYERLKKMVWNGAKMKTGIMKYHPSFVAQRKMKKEFQDKGYNDIFIPNMMVLSPQYAEYKKALDKVNDRMCRELGLHYDSNYNLVIKKSK